MGDVGGWGWWLWVHLILHPFLRIRPLIDFHGNDAAAVMATITAAYFAFLASRSLVRRLIRSDADRDDRGRPRQQRGQRGSFGRGFEELLLHPFRMCWTPASATSTPSSSEAKTPNGNSGSKTTRTGEPQQQQRIGGSGTVDRAGKFSEVDPPRGAVVVVGASVALFGWLAIYFSFLLACILLAERWSIWIASVPCAVPMIMAHSIWAGQTWTVTSEGRSSIWPLPSWVLAVIAIGAECAMVAGYLWTNTSPVLAVHAMSLGFSTGLILFVLSFTVLVLREALRVRR